MSRLPLRRFAKEVVIVSALESIRGTINCLSRFRSIKFSARAHPDFGGKRHCGVSLVRVSASRTYFLFHLGQVNVPRTLRRFLTGRGILGVNLSLHSSFKTVQGHASVRPTGFLSLRGCIKRFNVRSTDLRGVCTVLFGGGVSGKRHLDG